MNPIKGEVPVLLGEETYTCRLTIDALCQIEDALDKGIIEIVTDLTQAKTRISWLITILHHALKGGGNNFDEKKVKEIIINTGVAVATVEVAKMLAASLSAEEDEEVKKNQEK